MIKLAVLANAKDNVATSVKDLKSGQEVTVDISGKEVTIKLLKDIPFGHKFAVKDIAQEQDVIKYGEEIGQATCDIKTGDYVHVHNIVSERGRGDLEVNKK